MSGLIRLLPRVFVWFIPRYGRYTKAAILARLPCSIAVPAGRITRIEADGIFRQAMREPRRPVPAPWIMWGCLRLGALNESRGAREVGRTEAWLRRLDSRRGPPVIKPAAAVIVVSLVVFSTVVEFVVWIPLEAAQGIRERRHSLAKKVNRPTFRWSCRPSTRTADRYERQWRTSNGRQPTCQSRQGTTWPLQEPVTRQVLAGS